MNGLLNAKPGNTFERIGSFYSSIGYQSLFSSMVVLSVACVGESAVLRPQLSSIIRCLSGKQLGSMYNLHQFAVILLHVSEDMHDAR